MRQRPEQRHGREAVNDEQERDHAFPPRPASWTLLAVLDERLTPAHVPFNPPMAQTCFHSAAVTGCTERRDCLTSAMSASLGSALIAASVTGVGIGATALRSTATNILLLSVGSGKCSRVTSATPTISLPAPE